MLAGFEDRDEGQMMETLEQVRRSNAKLREELIEARRLKDENYNRAEAAEQRNVKLREALSHTLVTNHDPVICACVKCGDAREALKED